MRSIILPLIFLLVTTAVHSQHAILLKHRYYENLYDTIQHAEILGYYVQTQEHAAIANDKNKKVVRAGAAFKQDPLLPERFQLNFKKIYSVYNKANGFDLQHRLDKGHINPYTAFAFDNDAADESMYYSNVCPQISYFNEHQWMRLEMYVLKEIAPKYGDVKVWTGVLIDSAHLQPVGELFLPDFFWKVIDYEVNGLEIKEAWLGKNDSSNTSTDPVDMKIPVAQLKEMIARYYPSLVLNF